MFEKILNTLRSNIQAFPRNAGSAISNLFDPGQTSADYSGVQNSNMPNPGSMENKAQAMFQTRVSQEPQVKSARRMNQAVLNEMSLAPAISADHKKEVADNMTYSPKYWRNPNMDRWANNSPRFKLDEIMSALDLAARKYPQVPKELLGDVSGLESQWRNFQSPVGATGPFQFMPGTAKNVGLEDPMNATQSAQAAAKMISQGRLHEWDILNNPGAGGNTLSDFYTPEELAPFYNKKSLRWAKK